MSGTLISLKTNIYLTSKHQTAATSPETLVRVPNIYVLVNIAIHASLLPSKPDVDGGQPIEMPKACRVSSLR